MPLFQNFVIDQSKLLLHTQVGSVGERLLVSILDLNPIALRKTKIACNFGLSECNRVKPF